jgi:hypothetical protein
MRATYEVLLGPEALRAVRDLPDQQRVMLAAALREELGAAGPNSASEYRFDHGNSQYLATPLSFNALVAIHRLLTEGELAQLSRQMGRRVAPRGFWVIRFCSAVPSLAALWREYSLPHLRG